MDEKKDFFGEEEKLEGGLKEEGEPKTKTEPSESPPSESTFTPTSPQETSVPVSIPSSNLPSEPPSPPQEPATSAAPPVSASPEISITPSQVPPSQPEHPSPPKLPTTPEAQNFSEETSPPQPPVSVALPDQPTFTSPDSPTPPAPKPQKKSKKWWILGGCGGCGCLTLIALFAFLFIGGGLALFSGLQAPVKTVEEHLQAVTTGDFAKAYTYLSQELQKEMDLNGFTEFIKAHPENYEGINKISSSSIKIDNEQATIKGKVIYKDGTTAPLEATLIKEENFWKIQTLWVKPRDK